MTGPHSLVSLSIRSPRVNQAETTDDDEQNGDPGQHPHNPDEVGRSRGKEDRYERDDAGDGEKGRVNPSSYVLMGPLLQDRLRRHQHQRIADAEDGRQRASQCHL